MITPSDINSIAPAIAYINRLQKQVKAEVQAAIIELAELGVEKAKSTTLFRVGALAEHIVIQPHEMSATVLADRDYAYYLEEGNDQNGPFIVPVQAKALHFFVDGQEVFASKVKAHGPLPFMRNARDEVEREAPRVIAKHMSLAVK